VATAHRGSGERNLLNFQVKKNRGLRIFIFGQKLGPGGGLN